MKRYVNITAALFLCIVLTGCTAVSDMTGGATDDSEAGTEESSTGEVLQETDFAQSDADMFTDRDYRTEYDDEESIHITLSGDSACADSDSVLISGSAVTLTEEAVYVISGTLDDGMITVDAADTAKLQLVFNGVSINSETCAPLYILEADKVFVTLADGSESTLSNGGIFTPIDENNIDAVVFSKQDLTFNGSGSLTVNSPAGHGIVSKDDLVITGGVYTITSASHALDANDSVRITGETELTVNAGKDGIHSENNDDASLGFVYISDGKLDISAEGDGISAASYMQIEGGDYQISAGGGSENASQETSENRGDFGGGRGGMHREPGSTGMEPGSTDAGNMDMEPGGASLDESASDDNSTSMKGLKASGNMLISDGSFTIDSADDSVHSNMSVTVNGGSFEISSGDDAFHADATLTVTSGTVNISQCYEGLEALDLGIEGGEITLIARDDGLNAAGGTDSSGTEGGRDGMFGGDPGNNSTASSNGSITVSGGTIDITASGDGIDANGSIEISGGFITVTGPTQGDTATLDYDTTAVITGGTFIGTGASGMAQTFSGAEQGVIAVSVGEQSAGTTVTLEDEKGNVILSFEPELSFAVIIISSPDIESGNTYTLTAGDVSGDVEAE